MIKQSALNLAIPLPQRVILLCVFGAGKLLAVEHPDGLKTASKNASCTARGVFAG